MTMTPVRSEGTTSNPSNRLYLDDLHVGQRFTSKTHARRSADQEIRGSIRSAALSRGRASRGTDVLQRLGGERLAYCRDYGASKC